MQTFIVDLRTYIHTVIAGAESSIYKMITETKPEKIKLLASKQQVFIDIFIDLHTTYFTQTNNSVVLSDNSYIIDTFNNFHKQISHSKKCILTIVANLVISIHFNLPREKFDYTNIDTYIKSVQMQIDIFLSDFDIAKLFDHECDLNQKMYLLKSGEKFIDITYD